MRSAVVQSLPCRTSPFFVNVRRAATFLSATILAVACSSSSSNTGGAGTATVTGSVNGTSFSSVGSVLAISNNKSSPGVNIDLWSTASLTCSALISQVEKNEIVSEAHATNLGLYVSATSGSLTAKAYTVDGNNVKADFVTTTATCEPVFVSGAPYGAATSGTITLTSVSGSSYSGSFTLTFGTTGTLTGSFDAPLCDLSSITPSTVDGGTICQ